LKDTGGIREIAEKTVEKMGEKMGEERCESNDVENVPACGHLCISRKDK
jgi:hypothetical protein